VFETLKRIVRECLRVVGDPKELKEGRSPSILPGQRPSMYPEHLVDRAADRQDEHSGVTVPRAPGLPRTGR
jgi:hypothetical protein